MNIRISAYNITLDSFNRRSVCITMTHKLYLGDSIKQLMIMKPERTTNHCSEADTQLVYFATRSLNMVCSDYMSKGYTF